ncbi:MAG: WD40/YVTN/BNR-like repeat-containing protein, partial [Hyphomicrobiaceae bacterium]
LSKLPHLKSKILTQNAAEGMLDGHAITISPADPDAVVLACRMGLFRSTDRGRTWQDMEMKRFSPVTYGRDVRAAPNDPKRVYAALSVAAASHDGLVVRSDDAGKTWKRFDKVQVHGTVMSIAVNGKNPDEVLVGARYEGEVFATRDGGQTWTATPIPGPVKDIYCVAVG